MGTITQGGFTKVALLAEQTAAPPAGPLPSRALRRTPASRAAPVRRTADPLAGMPGPVPIVMAGRMASRPSMPTAPASDSYRPGRRRWPGARPSYNAPASPSDLTLTRRLAERSRPAVRARAGTMPDHRAVPRHDSPSSAPHTRRSRTRYPSRVTRPCCNATFRGGEHDRHRVPGMTPRLRIGLIVSAVLHVAILLFLLLGLAATAAEGRGTAGNHRGDGVPGHRRSLDAGPGAGRGPAPAKEVAPPAPPVPSRRSRSRPRRRRRLRRHPRRRSRMSSRRRRTPTAAAAQNPAAGADARARCRAAAAARATHPADAGAAKARAAAAAAAAPGAAAAAPRPARRRSRTRPRIRRRTALRWRTRWRSCGSSSRSRSRRRRGPTRSPAASRTAAAIRSAMTPRRSAPTSAAPSATMCGSAGPRTPARWISTSSACC